jgi:hypothetical protein
VAFYLNMSLTLESDTKPVEGIGDRKSCLANASFPKKLYDLVNAGDEAVVRWEEHGRAFRIIDSEKFAEEILPIYFRHSKLTSFQRQLNLYGFRRITKGEDQGSYYHAKFQRGRPNTVAEIRRLQGKAMPAQAGVETTSTVRRVTYGKKDVQAVDNSSPVVQTPSFESELAMMAPLDCSIPPDVPGSYDQSLPLNSPPPHMQNPSGFGVFDDTTPSFSRNVSDFGWCNNGFEGLDDFDPLDMNLLDALFDSDIAPS